MKRRDLLKLCLVAPFLWLFKKKPPEYSCSAGPVRCASMDSSSDGGGSSSPSISSKYPNKYDCEDYHNCTVRDCLNCKGSWMNSKEILRTEIYINHRFLLSYDRGLTDQEANAIMDINADADVTFMEFGWRKY